ncbi:uncharacterized protein LOC111323064 [Stylophora pistillata]|uniref:uncharacterized protein LOC111323064 n=1 Tax=Stylophora pistillata TaxID=50429 RepID=UPI000C04CF37|nr:uncharacterized protein LOC111323064 [Stylophora pistillata]
MKNKGSLLLGILFLVVFTGYATSLRTGGRNVLTRWVTTYTTERYSTAVRTTNGQTCTRIYTWGCWNCRRCRTQYKTVMRSFTRSVAKQKAINYCAVGWRANGDECTIPICTGGCQNGGRCISPERCQCTSGWQGTKCRSDVNECATNNGGCQHHCNNTAGTYTCFCDPGYKTSGNQCLDIDECSGPNKCQQKCVNRPGNYSCNCHVGYRLNNDSVTCSDIDECPQSLCQYKCNNTEGSFVCTCPRGYLLTTNKRDCADHDECVTGHHTCHQRCVNHPGGYSCACDMGFTLNNDNQSCSDIDECKLKFAGCAHQCNNTIGSFQCMCPSGYVLDADNRSCSDRNECDGEHNCGQICGNTPGSYYCTCRPGYYLSDDLRTCIGYPCVSISRPAKGYMNCTGKTVDSVCQFTCQPGYEFIGSPVRMCLTNGKWSGSRAVCKVRTCHKPAPPANGFVKIPCSTTYKGKCSFGCHSGFFLNGSKTVSCTENSTWLPIPGKCHAITVCHPNPCFHGGKCNPINSTHFWCNCTNTAYTGNRCHAGIFRKPIYPRLQRGSSVNITFKLSPPDKQLTVTPSASGLEFVPGSLVIHSEQLTDGKLHLANMTIKALLPGMHLTTYTLSGVGALSYQKLLPDIVVVVENETCCNDGLLSTLPLGCHEARLLQCPDSDNFLYARSTDPWKQAQGTVSTEGVATLISANNLTLPLGIRGTALEKLNLSNYSVLADNMSCKAQPPMDVQCLPSEIIASVFLQSLIASFPRWLRLTPSKTLSSLEPNEAITYLWSGLQLKGVLKGLGLFVNDRSLYSALLFSGSLKVEVNKVSVVLPKYDGKNKHIVVTDICSNSWPAVVLVIFNPLSYNALQAMPVYKQLASRGWQVTVMALQFSKVGALNYSVFTGKRGNKLISGSLGFYGRVGKTIIGSHPVSSLGVRLVGNALFGVSNIDKVWEDNRFAWRAGINGEVTAEIIIFLLEQKVLLDLQLHRSSGLVKFEESPSNKSCKVVDTYELSLNGYLAADPFKPSLLGSFIDSKNSKVSLYATSQRLINSSAKESSESSAIQLEFSLTGMVKFGPLRFPNMSLSIETSSEELKNCHGQGSWTDSPGLTISASFNQVEVLGRFFTCLESDFLQIFLPSTSQNSSEGVLETSVALLGDSFKTRVKISNQSLNFEKEISLFDNYRLSINGSSHLQSWDFLSLRLMGTFGKSDDGSHQKALEDTVKEMINDYIKVIAETTLKRLKILKSMRKKTNERISGSSLRLAQAENNTYSAVEQYLRALKAEHAAIKELQTAEKVLTNSTEELNELKESLERLCTIEECPYSCVSGTACSTCYEDLISREQGVCPATCHNLRQERFPPFWKTSTCEEEDCDHSGGKLWEGSTLSCSLEKIGRGVLKPAIAVGGTALLTSAGVPPVAAYAISSGVVAAAFKYDENKNPEEAVITGGATGAGKAIFPDASNDLWNGLATGAYEASQQCNSEGSWDCEMEPYPCPEEVFNYKYTKIPYQCETSCEVNVVRETIATPCCQEVNCASRIKELECQKTNAFCRITRQKAMSKLNSAKKNILKPLMELQRAKEVFNIVHIELVKRKIELEAASGERDTLRRAHNSVLKAADISLESNEKSRAFIHDAVALTQLWNTTNQTCPLDISEISFDVTLSSPSETQIPVLFKVASGSKEKTVYSIIDFVALNDSLQRTAKQIVKELFGEVNVILRSGHPLNQLQTPQGNGRKKRTIDERASDVPKLVEFKKKCALVTNYNRALSDIIGNLYNISRKSLQLLDNVTNPNSKQKHAESRKYSLNMTQAAEFGLTEKEINDSINAATSDKEVMNAASLIELRNSTNHKKVQTAIDMVLRDWEASMETVFNRTLLECSGFIDCMEDFVENFLFLYQGIDLPEAIRLRRQIAIIGQEVKDLLSYEDLSVSEAANKASKILKRLKDTRDTNVFCAVAPNITHHPVPIKNLRTGQTLVLSCKATGDPAPFYRWKKNGEIISGRKTETLRIEKVAKADSGNYTCEAYNHLTVEPSTPSYIVVHPPPVLVYQPPWNMNVPVNTGFFMKCTATSLSKPLRYQWIHKPFGGDSYTLVPNATFSVLNSHSVKKNMEGFYNCNVSNPFDYTLSHSIRLRILGFSLVVPSL